MTFRDALRRHTLALFVVLALAALYVWLAAFDGLGSLSGDGLIYVNTARHYAPYWPHDDQAATWARVTLFPPLFALLLAATGGAADFFLAHETTALCLVVAFAATYAWLVSIGIARARAALAAALVGIMPGTFLQSFYLHPEGLYLALSASALCLLALAAQPPRESLLWAAAGAIALAIVTRTVGVALLPALFLAVWRARPRHWAGMVALAVAPEIAWASIHHPPWSYLDQLREQYPAGISIESIAGAIERSIEAACGGLADNFVRSAQRHWLAVILGVLAGGVALWRFLRLQPDAWYVLAYLAMLSLWSYPQEAQRLTWVVMPFLLGYVAWLGERAASRLADPRVRALVAWGFVGVLALAVLPDFALLASRATHPLTRSNPDLRHLPEWYAPELPAALWSTEAQLGTVAALRAFAPKIPEGACVFSTLPLAARFYLQRDVQYPPWESTGEQSFEEGVRSAGCRYFVFTFLPGRGYTRSYYPRERLGRRAQVLQDHYMDAAVPGEHLLAQLGALRE